MEIITTFARQNTSSFDLGTLSFLDEEGEEFLNSGLSMPWLDLSLLIWSLQQLAARGGTVRFSASAASFDLKMSKIGPNLHLNRHVCSFQAFSRAVIACAENLLTESESVPTTDAGRTDLRRAVSEFQHLFGKP